jgi:hypothetical protein
MGTQELDPLIETTIRYPTKRGIWHKTIGKYQLEDGGNEHRNYGSEVSSTALTTGEGAFSLFTTALFIATIVDESAQRYLGQQFLHPSTTRLGRHEKSSAFEIHQVELLIVANPTSVGEEDQTVKLRWPRSSGVCSAPVRRRFCTRIEFCVSAARIPAPSPER